jgi:hypothetical protein
MAAATRDGMALGGMYDVLGGGLPAIRWIGCG